MGSKFDRYYHREIKMETAKRFAEWVRNQAKEPLSGAWHRHLGQWGLIERQAGESLREFYGRAPKYDLSRVSQDEFLGSLGVQISHVRNVQSIPLEAGRVGIKDQGEVLRVEEFAVRLYERQGFKVLRLESRPLHALFGTLMFRLIQDSSDPLVRQSGFGDRRSVSEGGGGIIWTPLPHDFVAPGYGDRRAVAIKRHIDLLPRDVGAMHRVFDEWLAPSANLRQYLWAHQAQDTSRARELIAVLGAPSVVRILEYLVGDYWGRYTGWPDLLVYGDEGMKFVEVKFSKDSLSEAQRGWIEDNATALRFPFELLKLHRAGHPRSGAGADKVPSSQ